MPPNVAETFSLPPISNRVAQDSATRETQNQQPVVVNVAVPVAA
jgi:hypothetical protein